MLDEGTKLRDATSIAAAFEDQAAVFRSLENLMTFPFVRKQVERGELHLQGAYFGVAEGSLFVLDPATKEFRLVKETPEAGA